MMKASVTCYLSGVFLSAIFATGHACAENSYWKLNYGADYGSGDYGSAEETDLLYLPLGVSYKSGSWTTKLTTAWLRTEGPGSVIGGGDGGVVIPGDGAVTTSSGLADTWVSVVYELPALPNNLGYLDLSAKFKIPTADEDKNLGTGEFDYTLQADYAYSMGRLTPLVTLAYKVKGDPQGVSLNNVLYLSAGAAYKLTDSTSIGASIDYQEASTDLSDNATELFTYASFKLKERRTVTPYLYFGFSDGSPDAGGGVQFSQRY